MASDARERRAIARLGGLARLNSAPSRSAMTEVARRTRLQRFYDSTDPSLPPEQRQQKADDLLREEMARLNEKKRQKAKARKRAVQLRDAAEILLEQADQLAADAG
jgi:hypothetical protein